VLGGQPVQFQDSAPDLDPLAVGGRAILQLDAGPIREQLQGTPEVDLLDLLDEAEEVAPLVAAEAVPGLPLGVDLEAGRLLGVEGAETPQLTASLAQGDVLLDDLDQVQARLDLVDRVVGPGPGHRCPKYANDRLVCLDRSAATLPSPRDPGVPARSVDLVGWEGGG